MFYPKLYKVMNKHGKCHDDTPSGQVIIGIQYFDIRSDFSAHIFECAKIISSPLLEPIYWHVNDGNGNVKYM